MDGLISEQLDQMFYPDMRTESRLAFLKQTLLLRRVKGLGLYQLAC